MPCSVQVDQVHLIILIALLPQEYVNILQFYVSGKDLGLDSVNEVLKYDGGSEAAND